MILPKLDKFGGGAERWIEQFVAGAERGEFAGVFGSGLPVLSGGTSTGGSESILRTGDVWFTARSDDPPSGALECLGQQLSKTEFAGLYNVVGDQWNLGTETVGFFRLLKAEGRGPVGKGGTFGSLGGDATLVLTQANLPAYNLTVTEAPHNHTFNGAPHNHNITDPQHTHTLTGGTPALIGSNVGVMGGSVQIPTVIAGNVLVANSPTGIIVNNATAGGSNVPATTGLSVASGGSASPINLRPLYAGLRWFIMT